MTSDLKWKAQVDSAASKANQILGMLNRTFTYNDMSMWKSLYTTFVRPHLEFASAAWNPYLQGDIDELEAVQHRATKLISSIRHLPYEERLKILGLTTLKVRRERGDMPQIDKRLYLV